MRMSSELEFTQQSNVISLLGKVLNHLQFSTERIGVNL